MSPDSLAPRRASESGLGGPLGGSRDGPTRSWCRPASYGGSRSVIVDPQIRVNLLSVCAYPATAVKTVSRSERCYGCRTSGRPPRRGHGRPTCRAAADSSCSAAPATSRSAPAHARMRPRSVPRPPLHAAEVRSRAQGGRTPSIRADRIRLAGDWAAVVPEQRRVRPTCQHAQAALDDRNTLPELTVATEAC